MAAASRFRFSPSPTGFLHVGGGRTALFNWLAARQSGGSFLLRIEDTDTERNREEWVEGLQAALGWLGVDWDEPPVHQSRRLDRYREAAQSMADAGAAYWCDCTGDDLRARRGDDAVKGYDGFCRDRGLTPGAGRALRFRTPDDGTTEFDDIVRGHVVFENANLEDFVILRSNGIATFLLANAFDDLDQAVTHVVRGDEHVNGTPKYLLLRAALGEPAAPVFAHLPVLVNEKRQKLSKRRDDVALEDYRARGYLHEALANYLATLGWGPPDGVEIRPLPEIVELFRLEDVVKSPAFFDVKKLDHFNGEYIRALPVEEFAQRAQPWLDALAGYDEATFERLAPLVQERVVTLADAPRMVDFVFLDEPVIDDASWERAIVKQPSAAAILDDALREYEDSDWKADVLHDVTRRIGEAHGLALGKAQAPIRVAVTGRTVGPPLFESLEVVGRERVLTRLRRARARVG